MSGDLEATHPFVLPWAPPAGEPAPKRLLMPAPPSLPEADRPPLDEEDLVSAAVVLDVLATRTRALAAAPTLLAEVGVTLAEVGALAGMDAERLAALLAHAAGATGAGRESVCRRLRWLASPAGAETTDARAVASALRRIERGAALVLREARLVLEASTAPDFRQV